MTNFFRIRELPPVFLPIDAKPFWMFALTMSITQESILASMPSTTEEEIADKEEARIAMRDTLRYERTDPLVDDLAARQGIPSDQMDSLWIYVQGG